MFCAGIFKPKILERKGILQRVADKIKFFIERMGGIWDKLTTIVCPRGEAFANKSRASEPPCSRMFFQQGR
jgi:hypothetical protein